MLCPQCVLENAEGAALCGQCGSKLAAPSMSAPGGLPPDRAKPGTRNIGMEGDILAIGLWFSIWSGILAVLTVVGVACAAKSDGTLGLELGAIVGAILLVVASGVFFVGQGLRRWAPWARWGGLGLTAMGILLQTRVLAISPVASLATLLIIGFQEYILYRSEPLFASDYRDMAARSGEMANPYRSIFHWLNVIGLVLIVASLAMATGMLDFQHHRSHLFRV